MAKQETENSRGDSFAFEIIRHYGVIYKSNKGWTREFNLVRWNNRKPKFDLRDWNPDHDKMSKGITMTTEEVLALSDLLEEVQQEYADGLPDDFPQVAAVQEETARDRSRGGREYAGELYEEAD